MAARRVARPAVVRACYLWVVDPTGAPQQLREYLSAAQAERSPSRVRQLAWVVSEMVAFAATLPAPQRPSDPSAWLDAGFVSRYLSDADGGRLRRRGTTERPSPDSTRRVRRACLRLLAEAARLPDPVQDIGEPGAYPYTLGLHASGYRGRLWTMRQYAGFGTAAETNARPTSRCEAC